MKIALIAVHQITLDEEAVSLSQCAGVLVLAAALQQQSFNCEVIDLIECHDISSRRLDEIMDAVVTKIQEANVHVLGLSTMTYNLAIALEISEKVKQANPSIITILGGPGVSFCAREVLTSFPQIDAVIRGEGEIAFPRFIESLKESTIPPIEGLVHRDNGKLIDYGWARPINDLDDVPFPLYEICFGAKVKEWFAKKKHGKGFPIVLEVGRGCPFQCAFCCTSQYFKHRYRRKSVKRILHEISMVQHKAEKNFISFNHDLLTFDHNYVTCLCEALSKHTPPLRWACFARLDTIPPVLLRKMRKAGCEGIYIGVDGATERVQRLINKHLDLSKFKDSLKTSLALGFHITLSFIVGIPGETPSDLEELLRLILYAKCQSIECVHIQIHALAPELGTAIYEMWKDDLRIDRYGSPGTAHVPTSWKKQFHLISCHPEIFSEYFYVTNPHVSRSDTLKLAYFGRIFDEHLRFSLQQAYSVLEDEVALGIVRRLTEYRLPEHNSPEVDYLGLMESIRDTIIDLIGNQRIHLKQFESIVEYEMAVYKVSSRRSNNEYEIIEVSYDPKELVECLLTNDSAKKEVNESNGFHMVFWDTSEQIAKSIPIPYAIAHSLQNRNIPRSEMLELLFKALRINVE